MVKKHAHFLVSMILLAALPATSQAQDLNTVINNVVKAMGSENLKTIRFSGSGSGYTAGTNFNYVKSYTRDIDLSVPSSRVQIVRQQGTPPVEAKETQSVGADAPWAKQFALWTNPWEFVKAAIANKGTVSTQTVFAQKFTVITFTVQSKYKVSGFINERNEIEMVQAWIDPNETLMETIYREYKDYNGLKFPSMIIEKQGGELNLVLMVSDVKPNVQLN